MNAKTIVAVLMLLATEVHAFDDPTDFRGLRFNEDLRHQMSKCPYDWRHTKNYDRIDYKERCWMDTSSNSFSIDNLGPIGNVRLTTNAYQVNDKLGALLISFPSEKFSFIVTHFIEQYGAATTVTESAWVSKGGVRIPNTTTTWKGKDIHIVITHLGGDLKTSTIRIDTQSWRDAIQSNSEDAIKDAAKDL